jgi:hypothetical protein
MSNKRKEKKNAKNPVPVPVPVLSDECRIKYFPMFPYAVFTYPRLNVSPYPKIRYVNTHVREYTVFRTYRLPKIQITEAGPGGIFCLNPCVAREGNAYS